MKQILRLSHQALGRPARVSTGRQRRGRFPSRQWHQLPKAAAFSSTLPRGGAVVNSGAAEPESVALRLDMLASTIAIGKGSRHPCAGGDRSLRSADLGVVDALSAARCRADRRAGSNELPRCARHGEAPVRQRHAAGRVAADRPASWHNGRDRHALGTGGGPFRPSTILTRAPARRKPSASGGYRRGIW